MDKLAKMCGGSGMADAATTISSYTLVKLRLICGRDLPKLNELRCIPEVFDRYCAASKFNQKVLSNKHSTVISPYVVVEVHGGGRFRCVVGEGSPFENGKVHTSKIVHGNGLHPFWDEEVECVAEEGSDAFLSFHVYARKGGSASGGSGELLAYEIIPFTALRSGYRLVQLRAPTGSRLQFGSLFVRLDPLVERTGGLNLHSANGMGKSGKGICTSLLRRGSTEPRGPSNTAASSASVVGSLERISSCRNNLEA